MQRLTPQPCAKDQAEPAFGLEVCQSLDAHVNYVLNAHLYQTGGQEEADRPRYAEGHKRKPTEQRPEWEAPKASRR